MQLTLGGREDRQQSVSSWRLPRGRLNHCFAGKLWETGQTTCLRIILPKEQGSWSIYIPIPGSLWLRAICGGWEFPRASGLPLTGTEHLSMVPRNKALGTGMQVLAARRWRVWEIWMGIEGVRHRSPSLVPSSTFHTWLKVGQSQTFLDNLELGHEEAECLFLSPYEGHCFPLFEYLGCYERKWGWHTQRREYSIGIPVALRSS